MNNFQPAATHHRQPQLAAGIRAPGGATLLGFELGHVKQFFRVIAEFVHPESNCEPHPSGRPRHHRDPRRRGPGAATRRGQFTQPTNLGQAYNLRSQAGYGRPITAIKTNLNVNLNASYTQNPGIVNGGLNYARVPAVGASIALSSNISLRFDFTLSTNTSQSYVRNTLQTQLNTSYYSQVSRLRLGWIVGPDINFQTDLMHQAYSGLSAGYNRQCILWNANLGKKVFPSQRGEIKLYTFDILGQNRSAQRNVTEAYYEDVKPPFCGAVSC